MMFLVLLKILTEPSVSPLIAIVAAGMSFFAGHLWSDSKVFRRECEVTKKREKREQDEANATGEAWLQARRAERLSRFDAAVRDQGLLPVPPAAMANEALIAQVNRSKRKPVTKQDAKDWMGT